jgi:hypothetical protein
MWSFIVFVVTGYLSCLFIGGLFWVEETLKDKERDWRSRNH